MPAPQDRPYCECGCAWDANAGVCTLPLTFDEYGELHTDAPHHKSGGVAFLVRTDHAGCGGNGRTLTRVPIAGRTDVVWEVEK